MLFSKLTLVPMSGRSIRIFLVDGSASGLRTAELGLSTIKALVVPRASLTAVLTRTEPRKTGVYILVGPDADHPGRPKIYIGEGDNILTRLSAHNRDESKDFWEEAILFVSKDENLTKAHVRFIEAKLIALAHEARRATVVNGTAPDQSGGLPEAEVVEMTEFIDQVQLLLGTLGFDLFEQVEESRVSSQRSREATAIGQAEFKYSGDGYEATCIVDSEAGKFVVEANSIARKSEADSLIKTYRSLRRELLDNGVLIEHSNKSYRFAKSYAFNSITAAAQTVSGHPVNGRTAWKLQGTGRTFAQWQDESLPTGEDD